MSAKALAYATRCPLIAVETFEVLAWQAPEEADAVCVLADGQQDRLHVQPFARLAPQGEWAPTLDLAIVPVSEWLRHREEGVWLTGPGLRVVLDRLPPGSQVVDPERWDPTVDSLLTRSLVRYHAGRFDDLWRLEPLYARASSAEEKWNSRV